MGLVLMPDPYQHEGDRADSTVGEFTGNELLALVGDNRDLAFTIVQTFQKQALLILDQIENSARENDREQLLFHLHKLAGSARSLGATGFGNLSRDIEGQIREGILPDVLSGIPSRLRSAYTRLTRSLELFLKS